MLPQFLGVTSGTVFLLAGDSKKFQCIVTGNPPSDLTWWKDGVDVSQGVQLPPVFFQTADRDFNIVNATVSDSGLYQCVSKTNFSSRQPELTISSPGVNVTVQGMDPSVCIVRSMCSYQACVNQRWMTTVECLF